MVTVSTFARQHADGMAGHAMTMRGVLVLQVCPSLAGEPQVPGRGAARHCRMPLQGWQAGPRWSSLQKVWMLYSAESESVHQS